MQAKIFYPHLAYRITRHICFGFFAIIFAAFIGQEWLEKAVRLEGVARFVYGTLYVIALIFFIWLYARAKEMGTVLLCENGIAFIQPFHTQWIRFEEIKNTDISDRTEVNVRNGLMLSARKRYVVIERAAKKSAYLMVSHLAEEKKLREIIDSVVASGGRENSSVKKILASEGKEFTLKRRYVTAAILFIVVSVYIPFGN